MPKKKAELSFFYLYKIEASKTVLGYFSLKKGCTTGTFIPIAVYTFILIMELFKSNNSKLYILVKHLSYSILNIISFILMLKSQYNFEYKKAYIGYIVYLWNFGYHCFLFMLNIILLKDFSSISLYFLNIQKFNDEKIDYALFFVLPNFINFLFEIYICWICYCYAKYLGEGKEDIVEGKVYKIDRGYQEYNGKDNESSSSDSEFNDEDIKAKGIGLSLSSKKMVRLRKEEGFNKNSNVFNISNFDGNK